MLTVTLRCHGSTDRSWLTLFSEPKIAMVVSQIDRVTYPIYSTLSSEFLDYLCYNILLVTQSIHLFAKLTQRMLFQGT